MFAFFLELAVVFVWFDDSHVVCVDVRDALTVWHRHQAEVASRSVERSDGVR